MTNLQLSSECYNICSKHFKKIVTEWFNMITRDIIIIYKDEQEVACPFSSMTVYDSNNNVQWSATVTEDLYFGSDLSIFDYRTNMQFSTRGKELGTYLHLNKWMIPYEKLRFQSFYRSNNLEDISEVIGTWTNGIQVQLNQENFQRDPLRNNRLVFAFSIENIVKEETKEEETPENDVKEIDCEHLTRDAIVCTNNLFEEVSSECDTYCQEFFLDGVINLVYLLIRNPMYVDVLHQGSLSAYQLSQNWNIILLDQEDIIFETNSEEESDIFKFVEENNWSKMLIGFPKSEKHLGVVTKMYVKLPEEVIRLKGFMEDESHVILTINNTFRILMNEPD
jgi:hypothetical protein